MLMQGLNTTAGLSDLQGDAADQGAQVVAEDMLNQSVPHTSSGTNQSVSTALDCFSMFNPTAREDYEAVIASWIGSLMVLARHLQTQPLQSLANFHAEQLQQPDLTDADAEQALSLTRYFPSPPAGVPEQLWHHC